MPVSCLAGVMEQSSLLPSLLPWTQQPLATQSWLLGEVFSFTFEDNASGELPAPGYLPIVLETLRLIIFILRESCGIWEVWKIGHSRHLSVGVG